MEKTKCNPPPSSSRASWEERSDKCLVATNTRWLLAPLGQFVFIAFLFSVLLCCGWRCVAGRFMFLPARCMFGGEDAKDNWQMARVFRWLRSLSGYGQWKINKLFRFNLYILRRMYLFFVLLFNLFLVNTSISFLRILFFVQESILIAPWQVAAGHYHCLALNKEGLYCTLPTSIRKLDVSFCPIPSLLSFTSMLIFILNSWDEQVLGRRGVSVGKATQIWHNQRVQHGILSPFHSFWSIFFGLAIFVFVLKCEVGAIPPSQQQGNILEDMLDRSHYEYYCGDLDSDTIKESAHKIHFGSFQVFFLRVQNTSLLFIW